MAASGQRFGRYALLATLGRGGFATVYRAHDEALDREVALKLLLPHLAEDGDVRQRFVAEARGIARLRHPNIATIYDVGEVDGRPFFTMELIEGQTLAQLVAAAGALPPARVVALVASLASAIDYLHRAGLVHRDIKPANVMLEDGGRAVLMDFGIARALDQTQQTRTGATLGTPEYMSPEQVRGAHVGPASDIYALGVLAYHLLAGRPPFTGDTAYLLFAQVYEPPPPLRALRPDLPEAIGAAVQSALAKDPAARPPSAQAFAVALGGDEPPTLTDAAPPTWAARQPVTPAATAPGAGSRPPDLSDGGAVTVPRPHAYATPPALAETLPTAPAPVEAAPDSTATTADSLRGASTTLSEPAQETRRTGPATSHGRQRRSFVALGVSVGVLALAAAGAFLAFGRGSERPASNAAGGEGSDAQALVAASIEAATSAPVSVASPVAASPATVPVGATAVARPAATSAASASPAEGSLADLALSAAEIGPDYTQYDVSTAKARTSGVAASYAVSFGALDLLKPSVQFVAVALDAYSDPQAAAAGLSAVMQELGAITVSDLKFDPTPAGGQKLGDETLHYKVSGQALGTPIAGYAITWRRGRYTSGLLLFGYPAPPTSDGAQKLARTQDGKLQNATP